MPDASRQDSENASRQDSEKASRLKPPPPSGNRVGCNSTRYAPCLFVGAPSGAMLLREFNYRD